MRTITTVAWNKLYKKDIFEDLEYFEGLYHEDEEIICKILDKANIVTYINCKNYYYLQRTGSITGNYSLKRKDILVGLESKMKFFKQKNYKLLYSRALYDYYFQLIYQYSMIKRYFNDEEKILKNIEKRINKLRNEVLFNLYLNPLRKVKIIVYLFKIKGV